MRWVPLVACGVLVAACEAAGGGTGDYLVSHGKSTTCAGAFTPGSVICHDELRDTTKPFEADPVAVDETIARCEGLDRCARPPAAAGTPATPGTLSVAFDTTSVAGTYWPDNIGAVWIEDRAGGYVRTLELWAEERVQSLVLWWACACRDPSRDNTVTKPDVITSATLEAHQRHTSSWNGRDFQGAIVPDGDYVLWVQMTESEFVPVGPFYQFPFSKGPEAVTLTPEALPGFANIEIHYEPATATDQALGR